MIELTERLWSEMGGAPERLSALHFEQAGEFLPSVYGVTDFAAATVALATLAVAECGAQEEGAEVAPVVIDRRHAALAFRSERYLERRDGTWPGLWDPIAGDYASRDGFIRLHTNYPHHRAAAERVLGSCRDRETAAALIAQCDANRLEADIVAEGGCAAAMRTEMEWANHPQGQAVQQAPTISRPSSESVATTATGSPPTPLPTGTSGAPSAPWEHRPLDSRRSTASLAGLRVLDLTRVIAGPVCTRVLAAWGADVLRIDPVDFEESDALVADTTVGKRCARIDLRSHAGRSAFLALAAEADVLVQGYRSDALDRLGLGATTLGEINPHLVHAALDAYGFQGPWKSRRGFDSLVQMSCGIAARGQAVFDTPGPNPLPAQALDHGSGYLLAAAVARALTDRRENGRAAHLQLSLAATARALMSMGEIGDPDAPEPSPEQVAPYGFEERSPLGQIRRIACPGRIGDRTPEWTRVATRLGSETTPSWRSN